LQIRRVPEIVVTDALIEEGEMVNCPLKNDKYTGECQYCTERTDCMLQDIMQKLEQLTLAVAEKKSS